MLKTSYDESLLQAIQYFSIEKMNKTISQYKNRIIIFECSLKQSEQPTVSRQLMHNHREEQLLGAIC